MLSFRNFSLLNALCNTYHAGFGYHISEQFTCETPNPLSMWEEHTTWIESHRTDEDDESENPEIVYCLKPKLAKSWAKNNEIKHSKVVIRLSEKGDSTWISKPKNVTKTCFDDEDVVEKPLPWYELPVRTTKYNNTLEEPLSSRKYIKVTDPYDEVVIKKKKNVKITLDDILFASRALCCGPDRSISEYHILKDSKGVLTLIAEIDNWST